MNEPQPPSTDPPAPAPTCTVPSLHALNLRGAKAKLRAGGSVIGKIHLAAKATAAKGKVVKQFEPAGTTLPAGTPVAVKLGPR